MKTIIAKIITGLMIILSCYNLQAYSQQRASEHTTSVIKSRLLDITFSKTTNLVFPYKIESVDVGSKDVIAQFANGVINILQLKAAKQGFAETNLTVVTSDGKLHSYILNYADNPASLNIKVGANPDDPKIDALFSNIGGPEAMTSDLTQQVAKKKPVLKKPRDKNFGVQLSLTGIYIKADRLYFQLVIENATHIDYAIDNFRLYIRDSKISKRTSQQEIEVIPVQVAGNISMVRGNSNQTIAIALDKFTIPDKKKLYIETIEQNGGRNLHLKITNKILIKALPL